MPVSVKAEEFTKDVYEGPLDQAPVAILVNANNKGYCRVVLDTTSQLVFLKSLRNIENSTNRSYVWRTLFDQVKLFKIHPQQFLECVFTNIGTE